MNALVLKVLVVFVAGWTERGQQQVIDYLAEENRVLREHLDKRRVRFTDDQRRRLALRAKALGRAALHGLACIVTPDTLLRWYRNLIAAKYDGSRHRGLGRPTTSSDIAQLVRAMATDNPGWGYTRLRGALFNLGHDVGRNTIKRILADAGLEPAPERSRKTTWKTFLKAHWDAIAAADFFTVEVLTLGGLVRYSVFFVMELRTRSVHVAGITSEPCEQWMKQIARNLTDATNGFLRGKRYLILDRDPLYTRAFRRMLKDSGIDALRLPARSPSLNAYAERFVLSIKSECLDRIIPWGEKHLRTAGGEFMRHYHSERNHQGLENKWIGAPPANTNGKGPVRCKERLGGMLRYYYREAA